MTQNSSAQYEKTRELTAESPTLIEGLPGLGLVASIAVDQITNQLELSQHGKIVSGALKISLEPAGNKPSAGALTFD